MTARDLTLADIHAAYAARRVLQACTVEQVAGHLVRYRVGDGAPRTAVLRQGGLRAGWTGTLVVERGVIVETK
jgi:hypothetical protein